MTYYARTARAFIADSSKKPTMDMFNNFVKTTIQAIKPGQSESELDNLITEMNDVRMRTHDKIVIWLEEHVDVINANDLDALVLYEFLMFIHPQMMEGEYLPKMQDLLDL